MASLILSSYRIDIPGSRSIIPTKRGGFQTVSLAVGINIVFIKLEAIQQFGDQSYIQVPGKDRNTALLLPWGQFQKSPTLAEHPRHPADNPDLDSRRRDPTLPWRPPQPSPLLAGYLQQVGWSRPTASCGIKSLQLPPAQTLLSAAVRAHFPLSCNQGGKLPK